MRSPPRHGRAHDGLACTRDRCDGTGQCQHAVITGPCSDSNGCTINDTCIDGQCVGTLQPDDSACDDGNACTVGDRCVAGTCTAQPLECPKCLSCNVTLGCVPTITTGCKGALTSSFVLRRSGTDTVVWQWRRGDATHRSELGDPTTTTDYDFCVYSGDVDAAGRPGVVLASRAPAGGNGARPRTASPTAAPIPLQTGWAPSA